MADGGAVLSGMIGRHLLCGPGKDLGEVLGNGGQDVLPLLVGHLFPVLVVGIYVAIVLSAIMSTVDPDSIRAKQRKRAGNFSINGIDLSPLKNTQKWGRAIIQFRTDVTVAAIRKARG